MEGRFFGFLPTVLKLYLRARLMFYAGKKAPYFWNKKLNWATKISSTFFIFRAFWGHFRGQNWPKIEFLYTQLQICPVLSPHFLENIILSPHLPTRVWAPGHLWQIGKQTTLIPPNSRILRVGIFSNVSLEPRVFSTKTGFQTRYLLNDKNSELENSASLEPRVREGSV